MSKNFAAVLSFILVISTFFLLTTTSKADTAIHLVISEIQIAGATATEDFIEIYNPTSLAVSLEGLRLVKRTSSGVADTSIVAFAADEEVAPHSYFLWCNSDISGALGCDKTTSGTVAFNNSVALRNGPVDTGTVVDSVTFGAVTNALGEGTPISTAPEASQSAERKATTTSTADSMNTGGADEFAGNGEDTDNNNSDFVLRAVSQPQKSSSNSEVPATPSATPTPTITPTESPTETPTPSSTPTESPSPTPESSPTISPSPTVESTPTATPEPTATPTTLPTETPIPTATPSPSPTPIPTSTPSVTPEPTSTPTPEPTATPSPTPTLSPTSSPTPTMVPTASPTATNTPPDFPWFTVRQNFIEAHLRFIRKMVIMQLKMLSFWSSF